MEPLNTPEPTPTNPRWTSPPHRRRAHPAATTRKAVAIGAGLTFAGVAAFTALSPGATATRTSAAGATAQTQVTVPTTGSASTGSGSDDTAVDPLTGQPAGQPGDQSGFGNGWSAQPSASQSAPAAASQTHGS